MQEYIYNLATDKRGGFIAGMIKVLLFLLALLYGLVIRILTLFHRFNPRRLNCKTISVGNITLGGTGKTVLVEYIARCLKERGHKVAVITRGYKRKITSYDLRVRGCENMGDEPFMLAQNLADVPVIVDSDRVRAARSALKDYLTDTVIMDDAFQQWRIKKDLEIVAIDALNPFGNRQMIPRGILREPLSALKRADVFILTKTNISPAEIELKKYLNRINPKAAVFESAHKPAGFYKIGEKNNLLAVDAFKDKKAALFCGIGDPDSFVRLVAQLGINAELIFRFPDHYNYTQEDLDKILRESQAKGIDVIITTEKDAARLHSLQLAACGLRLIVLRIGIEIKDEQAFVNRLLRLYSL